MYIFSCLRSRSSFGLIGPRQATFGLPYGRHVVQDLVRLAGKRVAVQVRLRLGAEHPGVRERVAQPLGRVVEREKADAEPVARARRDHLAAVHDGDEGEWPGRLRMDGRGGGRESEQRSENGESCAMRTVLHRVS